jgi:hypothetical protein
VEVIQRRQAIHTGHPAGGRYVSGQVSWLTAQRDHPAFPGSGTPVTLMDSHSPLTVAGAAPACTGFPLSSAPQGVQRTSTSCFVASIVAGCQASHKDILISLYIFVGAERVLGECELRCSSARVLVAPIAAISGLSLSAFPASVTLSSWVCSFVGQKGPDIENPFLTIRNLAQPSGYQPSPLAIGSTTPEIRITSRGMIVQDLAAGFRQPDQIGV